MQSDQILVMKNEQHGKNGGAGDFRNATTEEKGRHLIGLMLSQLYSNSIVQKDEESITLHMCYFVILEEIYFNSYECILRTPPPKYKFAVIQFVPTRSRTAGWGHSTNQRGCFRLDDPIQAS